MQTITFSRTTTANTRNGVVKQAGVEILETQNDSIMLSPVTKKGVSGSFIKIPKENIEELAKILLKELGYLPTLWGIDDVKDQAEERGFEITDEQAWEVLERMDRRHDASIGITWDTIDAELDDLDPAMEETLEDFIGDVFTPEQDQF